MSIYEFYGLMGNVLAGWQVVVVKLEWLDEPVCQQRYRQFISTRPFVAALQAPCSASTSIL